MKIRIDNCYNRLALLVLLFLTASGQRMAGFDQSHLEIYGFNTTTVPIFNNAIRASPPSSVPYVVSYVLGTTNAGGTFASVSSRLSVEHTLIQSPGFTNQWEDSPDQTITEWLSDSADPCRYPTNNSHNVTFTISEADTDAPSGQLLQFLNLRSLPIVRINDSATIELILTCVGFNQSSEDTTSASTTPSISNEVSESLSPSFSEYPSISESISQSPFESPSMAESPSFSTTPSISASEAPSESISQSPFESTTPSAAASDEPSTSVSETPSITPEASPSGSNYVAEPFFFFKQRSTEEETSTTAATNAGVCLTNSYFGLDFREIDVVAISPMKVTLNIAISSNGFAPLNERINKAVIAGDSSCPSRHSSNQYNISYFEFEFKSHNKDSPHSTMFSFIVSPESPSLWYLYLDYTPVEATDETESIEVTVTMIVESLATPTPSNSPTAQPSIQPSSSSSEEEEHDGGRIALFVIIGLILAGLVIGAVALLIKRRRDRFINIEDSTTVPV
eukprot:TRINITY_DN14740_c0_g1_i1.p1 TRINITY_DN14740_c0_g1~~TRINITY_DN14740_c0_g1_i1.p1  ORF type:complete len:508 (-),score=101.87 TRINITY_DN14740_c0_g1_i1:24-1547(-)